MFSTLPKILSMNDRIYIITHLCVSNDDDNQWQCAYSIIHELSSVGKALPLVD